MGSVSAEERRRQHLMDRTTIDSQFKHACDHSLTHAASRLPSALNSQSMMVASNVSRTERTIIVVGHQRRKKGGAKKV
ncbi:hypothetical protein BD414DRAFT_499310, partial [Trametes punicea]